MTEPAVSAAKLIKSYGGAAVLSVDSLEFAPGCVHVIVGPNGAGKTTLLRILNGIERPDAGTVSVLGREFTSICGRERLELQRRMAFCRQTPYLFRASVRWNVGYPLRVRGVGSATRARRVEAAMEKLGVLDLAERSSRGLSAGEAQRAALARATVADPEILLLDEPLANIDPEGVPRVEGLLRDLSSSGVTVLVATHVVEQAYRLSANVVRLEGGRVAPPAIENLLEGELVREDSGAVLILSGGVRVHVSTGGRGCACAPEPRPPQPPGLLRRSNRFGCEGRAFQSYGARRRARAAIDPRDIVVSPEKLDSSARNSLEARVTILRERRGLVFVTADAGVELTSCITPDSCRRLDLTVGSELFLTFKATAVKVF